MGQKYSAEYKADVLKLADEIGVSAASEQLGLSTKTVYNWRREERLKRGELRGVQPGETAEQAVERLLRENKELHEAKFRPRQPVHQPGVPDDARRVRFHPAEHGPHALLL